tara:strand:- start:26 stop:616 length:591 start_codon:yes stop_codon:yes gene_type:complete
VTAFGNYKSIIYIFSLLIAVTQGLKLVGYKFIMDTNDILFVIFLILLTIITQSLPQIKIMLKSLFINNINMDIDEIIASLKNILVLKKLLIFIAILMQFFGIMVFFRIFGSNPSLDPINGFEWLTPLSKGSFYILFISCYLIIIHSFEGKLIQSAYIQNNELLSTDKLFTVKFYFPLMFLSGLTFGIVSIVILILF